MRTHQTLLIALVLALPAAALAGKNEVTVQGYLQNAAGNAVDGNFAIRFQLYDAQAAGNILWAETQVGVLVTSGLFEATLGNPTNPLGLTVFRDNTQVWLGFKIEAGPGVPAGGDPELPTLAFNSVGFAYTAQHALVADALAAPSSRRWKKDIEPLEGALDQVLRLQGVSYRWKKDDRPDIGFIAEDVGQIVPEVVAYEDNGEDARTVDYARLTTLLVEAVKEQQAQIEEMKADRQDSGLPWTWIFLGLAAAAVFWIRRK